MRRGAQQKGTTDDAYELHAAGFLAGGGGFCGGGGLGGVRRRSGDGGSRHGPPRHGGGRRHDRTERHHDHNGRGDHGGRDDGWHASGSPAMMRKASGSVRYLLRGGSPDEIKTTQEYLDKNFTPQSGVKVTVEPTDAMADEKLTTAMIGWHRTGCLRYVAR